MEITSGVRIVKLSELHSEPDYIWPSNHHNGVLVHREHGVIVYFDWYNKRLSLICRKLNDAHLTCIKKRATLVDGQKLYHINHTPIDVGEQKYINVLKRILLTGNDRTDRTGVGTRSIFGLDMEFDISGHKLPLMTQRRISWKNIWAELLFFIRGQTDANILREQGVNIWNGNGNREFLDKIGLTERAEYDLGPVYGWQWRHAGAKYVDAKTDYTGQGFDQLAFILDEIRKNPQSRRLFVSAWNVSDLNQMVLPPCHHSFQFYVEGDQLSCLLNQRSGDMVLGVPYNIASYAALTHIVAEMTGLKARTLKICISDAHIYKNHIEGAIEMIGKETFLTPKIAFAEPLTDWSDLKFESVVLTNYQAGPAMKFEMAV